MNEAIKSLYKTNLYSGIALIVFSSVFLVFSIIGMCLYKQLPFFAAVSVPAACVHIYIIFSTAKGIIQTRKLFKELL